MKIQVIQHKSTKKEYDESIVVTTLDSPRSLDEFDYNIIDLSAEELWTTTWMTCTTINDISDFYSLKSIIIHSKKSKIIYVLPQNCRFSYDNNKRILLKNIVSDVISILDNIICVFHNSRIENMEFFKFIFEKTSTTIGTRKYDADFCFISNLCDSKTRSDISEKKTTIVLGEERIFATTLNITDSQTMLLNYIKSVFEPKEFEAAPLWMEKIMFFDDEEQLEKISKNKSTIESLEQQNRDCEKKIEENNWFKSILYTNGGDLVEVVFSILEKLFDCDLSSFVDKKKEDFLIKKENNTFIGEIKGVSSNVKSAHVSQIDTHYHKYMEEKDTCENVNQVLIINPLRDKPLDERDPVSEDQISLAKRNGCLIIETKTLLSLFDAFLRGEISTEKCIELFCLKKGLLKKEDFEKKDIGDQL